MDVLADKRGQGHTAEALADAKRVQAIWAECLDRSGGPFLFGGFTIADAMFAPAVTRFRTYGVELDRACSTYSTAVFGLPALREWIRGRGARAQDPRVTRDGRAHLSALAEPRRRAEARGARGAGHDARPRG